VPQFYERWEGPVPRRWVRRIKASLRSLGPEVSAARMVRDYVELLYEPTATQAERLCSDGCKPASELAAWKERVAGAWHGVHVDTVDTSSAVADLGAGRVVEAVVALGELDPSDVVVQLVHGPVGQNDEIDRTATQIVHMAPVGGEANEHSRYRGEFTCEQAGRYGFTVRVVPSHPDLASSAELGRIAWA
jgi:starch phosphorylase